MAFGRNVLRVLVARQTPYSAWFAEIQGCCRSYPRLRRSAWASWGRSHGLAVLAVVLFLGAGCAPKVVGPTPDVGHASAPVEEMLPVPTVEDVLRAEYEEWKGTPYRRGGSGRNGVDCSGLLQAVFEDAFGREIPRTSAEQSRIGEAVGRDEIQPGDLLFFRDRGNNHIGIAVREDQFLHATTSRGVIISELDEYWAPRLRRVSRVLE